MGRKKSKYNGNVVDSYLPKKRMLELDSSEYDIELPDEVFQKIMFWIRKATGEISGFGKVEFDAATKRFSILDAFLLEQENGMSTTDINSMALAKLDYATENDPGELRWWWHSHVNMGVFWSGTDEDTIQEIGENGWCLATVFNKKAEHRSAFCTTCDVIGSKHVIFLDEITLRVPRFLDAEKQAEWTKDFDLNCKTKVYTNHTLGKNGNARYSTFKNGAWYKKTWNNITKEYEETYDHELNNRAMVQKKLWDDDTPFSIKSEADWPTYNDEADDYDIEDLTHGENIAALMRGEGLL